MAINSLFCRLNSTALKLVIEVAFVSIPTGLAFCKTLHLSIWWLSCKELPCQCRKRKSGRINPWVGRYPGGGNVFLTGKSHAQRSLAAVRHNWAPKDQPYIHSNCPCLFRKTSSPLHRYIILKMYCSAIALQCVSSRCTTKWASYTCKYSHSFSFSRFFSHISCFRILSRVPCAQHQVLVSYLFYM